MPLALVDFLVLFLSEEDSLVLPLVPSTQWLAEAVTHRAGEGAAA